MTTLLTDAQLGQEIAESYTHALGRAVLCVALSLLFGLALYGEGNPGYRSFFAMVAVICAWRAATFVFEAFDHSFGKITLRRVEVSGLAAACVLSTIYALFTTAVWVLSLAYMFTS